MGYFIRDIKNNRRLNLRHENFFTFLLYCPNFLLYYTKQNFDSEKRIYLKFSSKLKKKIVQ